MHLNSTTQQNKDRKELQSRLLIRGNTNFKKRKQISILPLEKSVVFNIMYIAGSKVKRKYRDEVDKMNFNHKELAIQLVLILSLLSTLQENAQDCFPIEVCS